MKRSLLAISVFLLPVFILISCKVQPSLPPQGTKNNRPARPPNQPASLSQQQQADSSSFDSLLNVLIDLEGRVMADPSSKTAAIDLVYAAFDTSSGCFLTAGKGTYNKSHPESAWNKGRKIASTYDGKRWAMYLKAWSTGGSIVFGKKISGEITYSKTLREKLDGDTLYQLIQVPVGSVILK
jgi:hypothetical protein